MAIADRGNRGGTEGWRDRGSFVQRGSRGETEVAIVHREQMKDRGKEGEGSCSGPEIGEGQKLKIVHHHLMFKTSDL